MKRYILFSLCLIGTIWMLTKFIFTNVSPSAPPSSPLIRPSPTPKISPSFTYTVSGQLFRFSLFPVGTVSSIRLIPNFTKHVSSIEAIQTQKCAFLSSGGFYTPEDKPIGLFITKGIQLNPYEPNALFNGFFSVSDSGIASISAKPPQEHISFALQSGPILFTDGIPKKLVIRNDEPARRIVVAQTNSNNVVFMVMYASENTFEGPYLAHIPQHLKEIERVTHLSFVNALNLDGGSASAFITKNLSITELTQVGSFFCVPY